MIGCLDDEMMIRWLDADYDDAGHGSDGDGGDPNQSEDDNGKTLGASVLDDFHVYMMSVTLFAKGRRSPPQQCHKQTNASFLANEYIIYHINIHQMFEHICHAWMVWVILYHIISMFTILLMVQKSQTTTWDVYKAL